MKKLLKAFATLTAPAALALIATPASATPEGTPSCSTGACTPTDPGTTPSGPAISNNNNAIGQANAEGGNANSSSNAFGGDATSVSGSTSDANSNSSSNSFSDSDANANLTSDIDNTVLTAVDASSNNNLSATGGQGGSAYATGGQGGQGGQGGVGLGGSSNSDSNSNSNANATSGDSSAQANGTQTVNTGDTNITTGGTSISSRSYGSINTPNLANSYSATFCQESTSVTGGVNILGIGASGGYSESETDVECAVEIIDKQNEGARDITAIQAQAQVVVAQTNAAGAVMSQQCASAATDADRVVCRQNAGMAAASVFGGSIRYDFAQSTSTSTSTDVQTETNVTVRRAQTQQQTGTQATSRGNTAGSVNYTQPGRQPSCTSGCK